ncbi:hypothetical protein F4779DRAFT_616428 [Xylariaceae sp. FL0662B]|nr:hypothetical protein F4779DRAFT_616428 [Xylariaceae sp. FL0662B]
MDRRERVFGDWKHYHRKHAEKRGRLDQALKKLQTLQGRLTAAEDEAITLNRHFGMKVAEEEVQKREKKNAQKVYDRAKASFNQAKDSYQARGNNPAFRSYYVTEPEAEVTRAEAQLRSCKEYFGKAMAERCRIEVLAKKAQHASKMLKKEVTHAKNDVERLDRETKDLEYRIQRLLDEYNRYPGEQNFS